MASVQNPRKSKQKLVIPPITKVSAYDQFSGLLIALLVLVGTSVGVLVVIFFTTRHWESPVSIPVIIEPISGRGDHAFGVEQDLEAPGIEELDRELMPQIEADYEAVTEAITDQQAMLEVIDGTKTTSNQGSGKGDSRPLGPEGIGADIIPRWERWQIEFSATDLRRYAEQLDFFQIELGAAGGGIQKIEYASNFSGLPKTRLGDPGSDERLYFTWKSGTLRDADLQLLKQSGIASTNRIPIQFYPAETENLLAYVEQQYLDVRPLSKVKKTVFGIRDAENGFEFYVIRVDFR